MGEALDDIDTLRMTEIPLAGDRIDRAVIRQCRTTPDRVALRCDHDEWSYADLDRFTARVAAALSAREIGRNPLVGVCVGRSCTMIGCLLGVMRAGAAYLPLDPQLPAARLAQIVDDARPELIVCTADTLAMLPPTAAPTLLVEAMSAIHLAPEDAPSRRASDLAYVMYTSGSTGRPKGVEIEHASVMALIDTIRERPGFSGEDVLLSATRMSFDVSVLDFFMPLVSGARLVVASHATAGDPRRLAVAIERSGATVIQATPTTWRALLDTGWQGRRDLRIWSGGEALTADLAARLLPACRELWNLYGPTETTVWSAVQRIADAAAGIPIGRPIRGTRMHVLDQSLHAMIDGQVGELCISGDGLARGYRGRSDLTSERFVDVPAIGRVYRTGDLARRDETGRFHCLGRIDDQVKVRGFRIEMGEIETVLAQHPDIAWCAVRCWPDAIGENALFAYVVAREGGGLDGVQAHLRARLPAYMVPQRILPIDRMPLTFNGKIDRGALPPPESFAPAARDGAAATLTATERRLAAIWGGLLTETPALRSDDFFEMGGYSLLSVHLMCRIEERFGVAMEMADLLEHGSLGAMAAFVDRGGATRAGLRLITLRPAGMATPLIWLDAGSLLRAVMRLVDADRPILGLNVTAQDERSLIAAGFEVETLAALIVAHLRTVAPHGPLLLGGWCRWGIVAYEVARQLAAAGRPVPLLVLLDADAPAAIGMKRRLRGTLDRMRRPRAGAARPGFGELVERAAQRYRPGRYGGETVLLRAAEPGGRDRADGGWGAFIDGPLTIVRTPGDHESMVRAPHSRALAAALVRLLGRIDEPHEAAIAC